MLRKPWPIIFLSLFFFFIPFINIIVTYFILDTPSTFSNYILSLLTIKANHIKLFNMIIPSLISSVAIYAVRKWSFPIFIVCVAWLGGSTFFQMSQNIDTTQLFLFLILPVLLNIAIASYFLIPSVKTTYYNPQVRWWETKPRYLFNKSSNFLVNNETFQGEIVNISEGGAFIKLETSIPLSCFLRIQFSYSHENFDLEAQAIFKDINNLSYGVQFKNVDSTTKNKIKEMIKGLQNSNAPLAKPLPLWSEDLKKWFFKLITTGQGFTPKIPKK